MPRGADANSFGISGFSGKGLFSCAPTCHNGGVAPVVELEAPGGTTMAAGAIASFRFRITSRSIPEQKHAGFNVASDGGVLAVSDPAGTQALVVFGGQIELTHRMARANDNGGLAVFEFTWRAPNTPGNYTLFGAGNSVDDDGSAFGDNSARTTIAISVVGPPTATPTRTATPTPESPCVGDCDGSGQVTVDEIVTGVNIALGSSAVDACLALDRDGSATVTVDELVEAIQNALNGC